MKTLVLSNCAADPQTGSGSAIALALEQLRAAGAQVEFFDLGVVGIAGTRLAARYVAPLRAWLNATRLLRRDAYDLVVCFGGEWGLFTWRAASARRQWRLLQYSNGVESHSAWAMREALREPDFPRPRWYQRGDLSRIHDLAFRHADHVAVLSEFDARYLRDVLGLAPAAVSVLSTPLPEHFLGLPPPAARPPVVGYCGSWLARKNAPLIARDVEAFLRAFPAWRFEAVGPGTEQVDQVFSPELAARARGTGPLPREQLPGWYAGCSIVLLPSAYESFGLAAAEAMACGCAVVGSAGSAWAASLQHGEEVWLLDAPRSPGLTHALTHLAGNPELCARIARGGQRRAQSLSVAAWRAKFGAVLERLAAPASR